VGGCFVFEDNDIDDIEFTDFTFHRDSHFGCNSSHRRWTLCNTTFWW